MSFAREAKCIFCTFSRSAKPSRVVRRNFSSISRLTSRNSEGDLPNLPQVALNQVPKVSEEDLKKNFTPEQQAAIRAANKVLKDEDLERNAMDRRPWSMNYVDDLTSIDPVVDKPVRAPWKNIDESLRLKTDDELNEDLLKLMRDLPDDEMKAAEVWQNFDKNMRLTVGREEAERNPRSATAPDLPKLGDSKKKSTKKTRGTSVPDEAPSPGLLRLMQTTGLSQQQISNLKGKVIVRNFVANQTRLGKIRKIYLLYVVGNGNGLVGIGEGKALEYSRAAEQARFRAIRNMQPILRYENRTIFGEVNGKASATELELYARPPGFGLRVQGLIFEICRLAGIEDLAARVTRARNPMNTAKATIQALLSQKDPEDIARARGKKMVDVRKVYYANQY